MNEATMLRIADIAAGCREKEVYELTGIERTAIAISGGCEVEFTGTGYRCKNRIGIGKIFGRFVVSEGPLCALDTRATEPMSTLSEERPLL